MSRLVEGRALVDQRGNASLGGGEVRDGDRDEGPPLRHVLKPKQNQAPGYQNNIDAQAESHKIALPLFLCCAVRGDTVGWRHLQHTTTKLGVMDLKYSLSTRVLAFWGVCVLSKDSVVPKAVEGLSLCGVSTTGMHATV